MMGDKATLRMAQQELEDLYLGVPDASVDLTFKDLASSSSSSVPAAAAATRSSLPPPLPHAAVAGDAAAGGELNRKDNNKTGLARSSTNIFTYRPLEDREDMDHGLGGVMLQLSSSTSPATAVAASTRAAVADRERRSPMAAGGRERQHVVVVHDNTRNYRRPGIPHSNICTLCNKYVYLSRHRCLVCGRVYCRRCVGSGMGDMTEGRKCVDCLGRRYSHRYIHRAGDTTSGCCLCFWGYYPSAKAVTEQELVWAEKGPAPRRRPPRHGSSSVSTSYDYYNSTNTIASTSMSCDNSMAKMNNGNSISGMPPASASSSFVASSYAPNPHAFPL